MTITDPTDPANARPELIRPGRVPASVSSFVGRSRELAELTSIFETGRLITLTGPGGSGKTRLAIELAHALADRPGGPFRFVDLSAVADPMLVPAAIGGAFRVREQPDEPLLETVARRIGDRPLGLILDNLEQLDGLGPVLGGLLATCPNLRLLATSRTPLHVRGEREYPVRPLATPATDAELTPDLLVTSPAVQLFLDRASATDPRFAVTTDNAAAIAEICRRLDGLPLALELAAARIRMFGPDALLARLESRLALLTGGAADAPPRQRSLRDTIAWSVDLLAPEEREAFAALSVFEGGFTASAAAALVAADAHGSYSDLMPILERLVEHSLLSVTTNADGEPRFGMLETIREFAASQLAEARRAELRSRHLAFVVALVETEHAKARTAGQGGAIGRVLAEQANVRAALVHARATDPDALVRLVGGLSRRFWYGGPGMREGLAWFEEAERVSVGVPSADRFRLLEQGTWTLHHFGDGERGTSLLAELLAASDAAGDDRGRFEAWIGLGYLALKVGDLTDARERMASALTCARRIGRGGTISEAMVGVAVVARAHRDRATAARLLDEAVTLAASSGDRWAAAAALVHKGELERAGGEVPLAEGTLMQAVDEAKAARDEELEAWARIGLLRVAIQAGRLAEARTGLIDLTQAIRDLGQPVDVLYLLDGFAEWLGAAGMLSEAVEAASAAERIRTKGPWSHAPEDRSAIERLLARARRELGSVRFQAAWTAGEARSLDGAVATIVAAVDEVDPDLLATGREHTAAVRFALTPREREIVGLVAAGMSDGEVAEALVISKKTVSVHVANAKGKLGARNRVEIATMAARFGLIEHERG